MKRLTLLISAIILFISIAEAQQEKVQNLRRYDSKLLHFGFTVGLNSADFYIRNSDNFFDIQEIGQIYGIENSQSVGFHLGPISNFRLGEYFDLRILFDLNFSQRTLNYYMLMNYDQDGNANFDYYKMQLSSTYIEFPVLLKYKSQRINNYRFYVIGGVNTKLDLAAKKKIPEIEMPKIRLDQTNVYYEIGLGIDFYTTYFKFSPEIKFGAGLFNMLNQDDTEFSKSINYLKSNMVTLSFHFE